jgi:pSer/pThr/pTyr-binding forkhead associated (FHA) protein
MQAVLVMFRADGERRSFSITRDMTVIGRREDCDLRIPLGDVSRKHCRLVQDGDGIRIEDLGSSNGTYVNGQRVQEAMVTPGDSIQVGPIVFVLQVDGQPADDELTPITVEALEQEAPVGEGDMGPLSPTATSEVDEMPGLDSLQDEEGGLADDELMVTDDSDTRGRGLVEDELNLEADQPRRPRA